MSKRLDDEFDGRPGRRLNNKLSDDNTHHDAVRGAAINFTLTYPADHFFVTDVEHFCHNMTFFVYQHGNKKSYHLSHMLYYLLQMSYPFSMTYNSEHEAEKHNVKKQKIDAANKMRIIQATRRIVANCFKCCKTNR